MREKISNAVTAFLLCTLAGIPAVVSAATTVSVKVIVVAQPPCVINNNKTIDVDFGTILRDRLDGKNYRRDVNYTLDCKDQTTNEMRLSVRGNPVTFDNSALQTNISGLGISLVANGEKLGINDWLRFTYPNKPALTAIPVINKDSPPAGGDFQASATLVVAYP